ncbi:TonB-dependent receptor [Litoribacter populi]|uniref:TonB-dependent receptor n=1 Tax=Litoribacter populi TaxID=2598460 RepID=UPI00117E2EC7|nr:TonB-dependent receptor [Litoribacter populi]
MNKPLIFFTLCLGLIAQTAIGQDTRGEVKDQEFVIRKDRVLTLPTMPRNFQRTPNLPSAQGIGNLRYDVHNFFLTLPPVETNIQAYQKRFESHKPELFNSYTKLGFGNYMSPLAEIHLNSKESDYMNFGAFIKHQGFYQGPVDGENSAEDHTTVRLDGSYYLETAEVYGHVGYNRDKYHFYGYTPGLEVNAEDIAQVMHTAYGDVGIRNINQQQSFNYDAAFSSRIFRDSYLAREAELGLKAYMSFRANENLRAYVNTDAFFTTPQDQFYDNINRNFLRVTPKVTYIRDGLKIKAGANFVVENDVVSNKNSDFHIFPTVYASYKFTEEIGIFAGLEGDVIRNTYYDFVMENPFLGPSQGLLNTIQNFQISAGINGDIYDEVTYTLGAKYGRFSNMHFYGNNSNDSTRFELMYDDQSDVLNINAGMGWHYEDWYQLEATADYYQYNLSDLTGAWHRPEWELKVNNNITPNEKLLINASAMAMGGIRVINLESGRQDKLGPIFDLSARVDYAFTKQFSAFAMGNNLLNQNYQRFWNYRVRGIQGIGGITFKF